MNLPLYWQPLNGTIWMCKLSSRADKRWIVGVSLGAFPTRRNKAQLGEVWELHKDLARAICQTTFPHLDLGKEKVLKNVLDIKSTKKGELGESCIRTSLLQFAIQLFLTPTHVYGPTYRGRFWSWKCKKNTQTCSWYLLSLNAINDKLEPWLQQGAYKIYSVMFFTIITPTHVQIVHCTYQPWKCITKVH